MVQVTYLLTECFSCFIQDKERNKTFVASHTSNFGHYVLMCLQKNLPTLLEKLKQGRSILYLSLIGQLFSTIYRRWFILFCSVTKTNYCLFSFTPYQNGPLIVFTNKVWTENTHLLCKGKNHCTADLFLIGLDQRSKCSKNKAAEYKQVKQEVDHTEIPEESEQSLVCQTRNDLESVLSF